MKFPALTAVFPAFLLAIFLLLVKTGGQGLSVTRDSVQYLAAAHSLVKNGTFLSIEGQPLTHFPPLYSLLLLPVNAGIPFSFWAFLLNLVAVFFLLLALDFLLQKAGFLAIWRIAALAGFVASFSFQSVFSLALSDGWLLTLIALWWVTWHAEKKKLRAIFQPALFGAMLLLRYAAIFLAPLWLLWSFKEREVQPENKGWNRLWALFFLIPFGFWLARNFYLSGFLFGERGQVLRPVSVVVQAFVLETGSLLAPYVLPVWVQILVLGLFLALAVLFFFQIRKSGRENLLFQALTLFGVYALFLVVAGVLGWSDDPNPRLIAPLFLPVWVILMLMADFARKQTNLLKKAFFFSLLIPVFIYVSLRGLNYTNQTATGYQAEKPEQSTLVWILEIADNNCLITNDIWWVYYHLQKRSFVAPAIYESPPNWRQKLPRAVTCLLLWKADGTGFYYHPLQGLEPYFTLSKLEEKPGWKLYEVQLVP